ncbi:aldo/keto reductase [Xanthomonas citri pv. malvacearum]|uniref:aldo/keto reductase n=1 Tax=Xanthomonas citri TaxID=346 RepID=UPI0022AFE4EB|nr:aldo/keto reductase [Xanthomonas citri]WAW85973.1 aldo/keto reductase [Xanthomonas citri pv. malvacearum]WAW90152.1 aldo/keto reductase [Xanthomonas citri pv. malvacearum]WAW94326.1 aldo/keto reductase [Xanthomonas citri pv. malvacearum]
MSESSSPSCAQVRLRNGRRVPALGLGSWNLGQGRHASEQEIQALQLGQQLGMQLIDTAEMYGNGRSEQLISQAIYRTQPPYVVSKVLPSNASARGIAHACEASLQRLGVRTLDLYLLHWRGGSDLAEVVDAFEALRDAGKIRDWGVSNFDVDDMEELWAIDGGSQCLVNQVLYHAGSRGIEFDLLPWCAAHEVAVMAYSPLGSRALLDHPVLHAIGERRGVAATAVALAWAIRSGNVIAIPESGTPAHVRANAAACTLQLHADDLAEIDRAFAPPTRKQPLDLL